MNYSIFNVCSCSNMISVTGFVNLLEKRKIGEISAKAERTGGIFQQYATKSNFMCCSISFKTPVTTANFNQPTNNLACNKKLTTYKQSINVAMWYVWYCSNFHSKKKKKGGKERKIFKSQKKKYPFFAFPFFQYFETWEKLTTNSPATSEQNFVQKANWTNNETFRIFKIPAISSIEAKKRKVIRNSKNHEKPKSCRYFILRMNIYSVIEGTNHPPWIVGVAWIAR